jgi:hypothetical protein
MREEEDKFQKRRRGKAKQELRAKICFRAQNEGQAEKEAPREGASPPPKTTKMHRKIPRMLSPTNLSHPAAVEELLSQKAWPYDVMIRVEHGGSRHGRCAVARYLKQDAVIN